MYKRVKEEDTINNDEKTEAKDKDSVENVEDGKEKCPFTRSL